MTKRKLSKREQIERVLSAGGLRAAEIAHKLGGKFTQSRVHMTCQRLMALGIVTRENNGDGWIYFLKEAK